MYTWDAFHGEIEVYIPFLEGKGDLMDIGAGYAWPDYLSEGSKTQLAGLWKKLQNALENPDQEKLRAFFKVN